MLKVQGSLLLCLLVLLGTVQAFAQDLNNVERARSQSYPVSIALPMGWQSFQGDPKTPGEVLFLQTPQNGTIEATVSLAAFPMPHSWEDLLRRQTFQLVVELDAPVLADEALTLRGAKGHKWVYRAASSAGREMIYYELYLAAAGGRLLVMHASAPAEQADEALHVFTTLAGSLAWGNDSATPLAP